MLELVLALITLFPHSPSRDCLIARRHQIASVLEASQERFPEMPPELVLAVGFMETHNGCDRNEGGNWGAPISNQQRHVAGRPIQAAASLWTSYQRCNHSWEAATRRFRTGLCSPSVVGTPYSRTATRLASRIQAEVIRNQEDPSRVCRIDPTLERCHAC